MDMKHAYSLFKLNRGEGNITLAIGKTLAHVLVVLTHNVIDFQYLANSKAVTGLPCFR